MRKLNPDEAFMDFSENENFAEASCGCIIQRRDEGGVSLHMCNGHRMGPEVLKRFKEITSDLKASGQFVAGYEELIKKAEGGI
jgi:hypothetical protein